MQNNERRDLARRWVISIQLPLNNLLSKLTRMPCRRGLDLIICFGFIQRTMNTKGYGRKQSWPNSRNQPSTRLETKGNDKNP
jgi:hypothetical protein